MIKCPKCGKEISDTTIFCPYCKKSFKKKEPKEINTPLIVTIGSLIYCLIFQYLFKNVAVPNQDRHSFSPYFAFLLILSMILMFLFIIGKPKKHKILILLQIVSFLFNLVLFLMYYLWLNPQIAESILSNI